MVIDALLKDLDRGLAKGQALDECVSQRKLQKFIKHKLCQENILKLAALGGGEARRSILSSSENVVVLYKNDNWTVSLVRQSLSKKDPYLITLSSPVLGVCVHGEGTSTLCQYAVDGDLNAPSQSASWTLIEEHKQNLQEGALFSCQDPARAIEFTELSDAHIFLRFVHKPITPQAYVFDAKTKAFSYQLFSDEAATGQFFFADLLNHMVGEPDCIGNMSPDQRENLMAFCDQGLGDEGINLKARWRLLQTMGMLSQERVVVWLERFSEHPDPGVSQVAKATLDHMRQGG